MPEQGKDSTRHADTPITTPESRSPRPAAGIPATPPPLLSAKSRRDAPVRDVPKPPVVVAHVTVETPVTVDAPAAIETLRQTPAPDPSGQRDASLARTDTALLLDVIAAAEGISSAGDRTAVLERVASLPNLAPAVVTALGRAASRVPSGTSRAKLLRTIVRKQSHAAGVSRRAVLDALNGEIASTDFASVLEVFVQREGLDEAALADAFTAAARISSNSEKARVLVGAARLRKPEGTARAAYLMAAGTIASGSERARALAALFEDPTQRIDPPGS